MKSLSIAFAMLLLATNAVPAAGREAWTVFAGTGITAGNQTEASAVWWGAVHRWTTSNRALGLEAGYHRWEGRYEEDYSRGTDAGPFSGLARGGHHLQHLAASLRFRGGRSGTAPTLTMGCGVYRQMIDESIESGSAYDPRQHQVGPGLILAIGGAGKSRIAPGAELRFEWIGTRPGPSAYLTATLGLNFTLRSKGGGEGTLALRP